MKQQWPGDSFYERYSFSTDFGHSGKDEFLYIKDIIEKNGLDSNAENVWQSLDFVKNISKNIEHLCQEETEEFGKFVTKNRITAGYVPPDIFFGYEILKFIVESALLGVGLMELIGRKKSGDKINKLSRKVAQKIVNNNKANKIIINYFSQTKEWNRKDTKKSSLKKKTSKKRNVKT